MESSNNFVATVGETGFIVIWSLEAAVEGKETKLTRFRRPVPDWISDHIGLGANFVVSHHQSKREIVIFDFL